MRTSIFCAILFVAFCCLALPQKAQAFCYGGTAYGSSYVLFDDQTQTVYGYSATELDYCAGLYYDPYVEGYLYQGNSAVDAGSSLGYADYYAAEVYTASAAQPVTQYTVLSDHYVVAYYSYYGCTYCFYDPFGYNGFAPGGDYGGWYDFYGGFAGGYYDYQFFYLGSTYEQLVTPSWCQLNNTGSVYNYNSYYAANTCSCQEPTVHITFAGSGIPLAKGTPPANSPPFVDTVQMKATTDFLGGTYHWYTTSDKVTLINDRSETVTVKSKAESGSRKDVIIQVDYTVPDMPPAHDQIAVTVQKPSSMKLEKLVSDHANTCASGTAGWEKRILWQLSDQFGDPISFVIPTYDDMFTYKGRNGCGLTLDGTKPGARTDKNGQWPHRYWFCNVTCVNGSCKTEGYQRYYSNGFTIDIPFVFECNKITVAGDGSTPAPTPSSPPRVGDFVQDFWQGTYALTPSDGDWQYWTGSLSNAQAQGQAALLSQAQLMGRALFQSADYLNRNRSDEDYVYDLYLAYLQRPPDTSGYNFWLSILRNDNANGIDGRAHLLTAFEVSDEFRIRVYALNP
jgi:Domain of unknown function (DUF4214)